MLVLVTKRRDCACVCVCVRVCVCTIVQRIKILRGLKVSKPFLRPGYDARQA